MTAPFLVRHLGPSENDQERMLAELTAMAAEYNATATVFGSFGSDCADAESDLDVSVSVNCTAEAGMPPPCADFQHGEVSTQLPLVCAR